MCAATGSVLSPFKLETTGGNGASLHRVGVLLDAAHMRASGLPADVLLGKLNKDIQGTIAHALEGHRSN